MTQNSCLDRRWRQQSGLKVSHAPEINPLPGAKVAVITTRNERREPRKRLSRSRSRYVRRPILNKLSDAQGHRRRHRIYSELFHHSPFVRT